MKTKTWYYLHCGCESYESGTDADRLPVKSLVYVLFLRELVALS